MFLDYTRIRNDREVGDGRDFFFFFYFSKSYSNGVAVHSASRIYGYI